MQYIDGILLGCERFFQSSVWHPKKKALIFLKFPGIWNGVLLKLTELVVFMQHGTKEIVRLLLAARADKNRNDGRDRTALLTAADEGHVDIVQQLLDAGAGRDNKDMEDFAALHRASFHGFTEIVHLLLQAAANPNIRGRESASPLHCASACGHVQIVRLLLDARADRGAKDFRMRTALDLTIPEAAA